MGNFSKHTYPGLSIHGILNDHDEMIRLSHLIVPTRVMEVNSILVPIDRNAPSTWPIPPIGQNCKYASGIFNGVRSVPQKDVELFYTGIKAKKTLISKKNALMMDRSRSKEIRYKLNP